ncbi:MAG: Hsp20/alpha crystallin family protein [Candidatus Methylacidiphilales bacterium]|nr:Hsp20/alpha crystallin family protein [Candidatus Methylacidiphilales bacterium]
MKLIMRHDPFFSLNPLAGVADLRRDVGRLFDFAFPTFGHTFAGFTQNASGNVDLYRAGDKFVLRAELPGVPRENIGVEVVDGKLVLSVNSSISVNTGEKPAVEAATTQVSTDGSEIPAAQATETEIAEKSAPQQEEAEQSRSSYTRSFKLPAEIDSERISARYEHGVLTVELPQREQVKPRSINVEVS